jgi:Prefoldin subunit.
MHITSCIYWIAKLIQSKVPEIEKSLKLVKFLKSKESASQTTITTRYNLADLLYSKATVDCASGIVNLWLGANVMLEYTYDEAIELLGSKLEKATQDLEDTKEDLALVRNQIITSEVNISRIYNWDVRRKREERLKGKDVDAH